jgi:hypothetical protein
MSSGLSDLNRALNLIPKRAETRQVDKLRDTFVDSGVAATIEGIDHQVLFGRRGTGKTHALGYLQSRLERSEAVVVYADLRTIGSPEGLFLGSQVGPIERAGRLLVDLLGIVHESILTAALNDDELIDDTYFVARLDALLEAITTVTVSGEVEIEVEGERKLQEQASWSLKANASRSPSIGGEMSAGMSASGLDRAKEVRKGHERIHLNFADVARSLRELTASMRGRRIWLLLDEWSSVPSDIQPMLGEFLVRCVLPIQPCTVKIAAIEQQTNFRTQIDGRTVGIELGADVTANVDLDEFMVFEQNDERSISFFRGLLYRHLTQGIDEQDAIRLQTESEVVQLGFTEKRAFEELVRAAEGVPRDAINIAAKAAFRAGPSKISVPDVRVAARSWFYADKEAAIKAHPRAQLLLNWTIDNVIKGKRARGFLVNQKSAGQPLLLALFDARVLHLVRRGYSAQDEPGERYDVWVIDYGAYVDLIHTKYEPQGFLPMGDDDSGAYVEVPTQDLRAIRRAVLDLDKFTESVAASEMLDV